jgi:hypothetical protein
MVLVTGRSGGVGTGRDYATIAYLLLSIIEIDTNPGSFPNTINTRVNSVITVALLGSEDFDVADVDVATLRFGPDEASPAHDLTDTWIYTDHLQDLNLDGFMDLMLHFEMEETGIACGNEIVILTGAMLNGRRFWGEDAIQTVGCGLPRHLP